MDVACDTHGTYGGGTGGRCMHHLRHEIVFRERCQILFASQEVEPDLDLKEISHNPDGESLGEYACGLR